jgi:succinyl-diaminopimelate desuccinylase
MKYSNNLFNRLIKIESTSENSENLLKVIDISSKYLDHSNIFLNRFLFDNKPSLMALMSSNKNPTIILNGHLDVVPGKPSQFKPKRKGDRLYARGAQDMKAACAVMMKVFKDLAKDKSFPRDKLGIMLVTDEEVGGFNGTRALLKKGYKGKFVMTGEPTEFDIEIEAKGVLWIKLTAKGKAAHGAYLWEGDNAITKISEAIKNINKLFPAPTKEVWKTTCNIASVSGGSATNRVPDICELKLDIRYVPKDDPEYIFKKIRNVLPKNIDLEIMMKEPFLKTDKSHRYLKLLKQTADSETGKQVKFVKKNGASDGRFFSEIGIPTTSFGPVGGGQHSDNEWMSLKSLKQYELILKRFLKIT